MPWSHAATGSSALSSEPGSRALSAAHEMVGTTSCISGARAAISGQVSFANGASAAIVCGSTWAGFWMPLAASQAAWPTLALAWSCSFALAAAEAAADGLAEPEALAEALADGLALADFDALGLVLGLVEPLALGLALAVPLGVGLALVALAAVTAAPQASGGSGVVTGRSDSGCPPACG